VQKKKNNVVYTNKRDSNKRLLHFKKRNNRQAVDNSEEILRKIPEPKKQEILSELATNK